MRYLRSSTHKALLPCAASESVCALPGWVRDGSVAVWWRGVSVKVVGGTVRRGAAAVVAGGRWGGGSSVVMWPSCDECGEHDVASMRVMPTSAAGGAAPVAGGGQLFAGRRCGFRYRWFGGTVLRSCRRRRGLEEVADARLSGSVTSVVGCNLIIRAPLAASRYQVAIFPHVRRAAVTRRQGSKLAGASWSGHLDFPSSAIDFNGHARELAGAASATGVYAAF